MSRSNPLVPPIIGRLQATRIEELEAENDKLRLLVRDLWLVAGLQDAIGKLAIHAHGTDWRTFEERVSEALGLEEDA